KNDASFPSVSPGHNETKNIISQTKFQSATKVGTNKKKKKKILLNSSTSFPLSFSKIYLPIPISKMSVPRIAKTGPPLAPSHRLAEIRNIVGGKSGSREGRPITLPDATDFA